jgi:hypothetical protein
VVEHAGVAEIGQRPARRSLDRVAVWVVIVELRGNGGAGDGGDVAHRAEPVGAIIEPCARCSDDLSFVEIGARRCRSG